MAVYNEIVVLSKGKHGYDALDNNDNFHVKQNQNILAINLLRFQLDYGESEAIVLAIELEADILLLDEKKARKVAQVNSQPVIGTIGILQAAKNKNLISDIKPHLDGLIANGFWIDKKLYQTILQNNGE